MDIITAVESRFTNPAEQMLPADHREIILRGCLLLLSLDSKPPDEHQIEHLAKLTQIPTADAHDWFEAYKRQSEEQRLALVTLKLSPGASPEEIQAQYEQQMELYDAVKLAVMGDKFANLGEEKREELTAAYQVLQSGTARLDEASTRPDSIKLEDCLLLPITKLRLNRRTVNCLAGKKLFSVGDVMSTLPSTIKGLPNFGRGCWMDLCQRLQELTLQCNELDPHVKDFAAERAVRFGATDRPTPTVAAVIDALRSAVQELDWKVVVARYGLDGSNPMTLDQIGQNLFDPPVGRERIRQREERARRVIPRQPALRAFCASIEHDLETAGGLMLLEEVFKLPSFNGAQPEICTALCNLFEDLPQPPFVKIADDIVATSRDVLEPIEAAIASLRQQIKLPCTLQSFLAGLCADVPSLNAKSGEVYLSRVAQAHIENPKGGEPLLMAFESKPDIADRVAAILQLHPGPQSMKTIWGWYQDRFPAQAGTEVSISNAITVDSRFFAIDPGTWILRDTLDLPDETWHRWRELLLELCWSAQQITDTRYLLECLGESEDLPEWLNPTSLYWLVRSDDNNFKTYRRFEVAPAGPKWERRDLLSQISTVLERASEPMTTSEIHDALQDARNVPFASTNQALIRGEETGNFFRVRPATWALATRLALDEPLEQRLRLLAIEALTHLSEPLQCAETKWRSEHGLVPSENVDYTLSMDPELARVAPGTYLLASSVEHWLDMHTAERAELVLRDVGHPISSTELKREMERFGKPLSDATLALAAGSPAICRYPFSLHKMWLGLQEWGEDGYRMCAEELWPSIRRNLQAGALQSGLDDISRKAIETIAREKSDHEILAIIDRARCLLPSS